MRGCPGTAPGKPTASVPNLGSQGAEGGEGTWGGVGAREEGAEGIGKAAGKAEGCARLLPRGERVRLALLPPRGASDRRVWNRERGGCRSPGEGGGERGGEGDGGGGRRRAGSRTGGLAGAQRKEAAPGTARLGSRVSSRPRRPACPLGVPWAPSPAVLTGRHGGLACVPTWSQWPRSPPSRQPQAGGLVPAIVAPAVLCSNFVGSQRPRSAARSARSCAPAGNGGPFGKARYPPRTAGGCGRQSPGDRCTAPISTFSFPPRQARQRQWPPPAR